MSNPDFDQNFEAWLKKGLQTPIAADTVFVQQVLNRLEMQKAENLLRQLRLQKRIFGGLSMVLIFTSIGAIFLSPLSAAIYAFLQMLLLALIQLILQPTLTGLLIPGVILILAGVVLWNLIEIISLE